MFNKEIYKKILEEYRKEIASHYEHALRIYSKFENDDSIVKDVFIGAIIHMCIKYEALTSDIQSNVYGKDPRYNHPWSNTRNIAKKLGIDISKEYKRAHDAWDIYNSLKHINYKSKLEKSKILKNYKLNTIYDMAKFILDSLDNLIKKMSYI